MKNGNLIALQVWELDAVGGGASNKHILSQSLGLVNDIKLPNSPADLTQYIADKVEGVTKVVRAAPFSPLL
ncbi:hypothetical protein [Glaciimonas sp. CA11.2]|uniref:hypothetical protein n=1 Tax=Glaciimonas sp. CA11.2 TaxID=3048601 RepID=UPI002B221BE8|nr:hypothetical protein [Glaciimonas sp. CA11.2]